MNLGVTAGEIYKKDLESTVLGDCLRGDRAAQLGSAVNRAGVMTAAEKFDGRHEQRLGRREHTFAHGAAASSEPSDSNELYDAVFALQCNRVRIPGQPKTIDNPIFDWPFAGDKDELSSTPHGL